MKGREAVAHSSLGLSALYFELGRWEDSRTAIAEGLAAEVAHVHDALMVNLSGLEYELGETRRRRATLKPAWPTRLTHWNDAARKTTLVWSRLSQGLYAEAEEIFATVFTAQEPFGATEVAVQTLGHLAETRLRQGRLQEAEHGATRAVGIVTDCAYGDGFIAIPLYWTLAGVALARGQLAEADRLLRECDDIGADSPAASHHMQPELLYRQAQLRRLQGRGEEADGLAREACHLLDERRRGSPHPRAEAMRAEWAGSTPQ